MTTHLGVDGCPAGWIVAEAASEDARPGFWLAPTFAALLERGLAPGRIVAIDVPIGLADGRRGCDAEARRILGPRRASSVFTPPCHAALAHRTADGIRAENLRRTGRSLSAQALGIVPKIRELDRAMTPALQRHVREVHPEVVFASLAGRGVAPRKGTDAGRRARLALLPRAWAAAAPSRTDRPFPASQVRLDDYLDALAALLAALRIARGDATSLPRGAVERDARGLRMEIVF